MVQTEHVGTSREELDGSALTYQDIAVNPHYRIIDVSPLGQFLINEHDPMIALNIRNSLRELEELAPLAQGVVIDIGANIGGHSLQFAKTAQAVYAFEPQPHSFYCLCANIAINGITNVIPMQYALGDSHEMVYISPINPTLKHVCQGAFIGEVGQPVEMQLLDAFGITPVSFIKIDVEGYELEVLQGATDTLKAHKPTVYVEVHEIALIKPIKDFMGDLGYLNTERIIQYTEEDCKLTHGYLFWQEGRIAWTG